MKKITKIILTILLIILIMIIALFLPVIPKTKKTIKPECAQIFRNPSYVAISKETTKNCTIPATYKSLRTIYKENKE